MKQDNYQSPQVEFLLIECEQGFAMSFTNENYNLDDVTDYVW